MMRPKGRLATDIRTGTYRSFVLTPDPVDCWLATGRSPTTAARRPAPSPRYRVVDPREVGGMPPLPTQAQPQRARGRRPSGVCLLGQPRSRASHLPLGGCLDADKATADRGLRAPYLAQTYPDDHRHPRVGEDAGGQHPGHARRPALPEFTDRGSLHHELLWLLELCRY